MKKGAYHVSWSIIAKGDLNAIIDFIAVNNPQNAVKITEQFEEITQSLYLFPSRGRVVPELEKQDVVTYRELLLKPWRIIYRIEGRKVYVLAVLDGRRNLEDILLERFIRDE